MDAIDIEFRLKILKTYLRQIEKLFDPEYDTATLLNVGKQLITLIEVEFKEKKKEVVQWQPCPSAAPVASPSRSSTWMPTATVPIASVPRADRGLTSGPTSNAGRR